MSDPRHDCPSCDQRIHPLDLSDLHRGRKLNCAYCASGLRATIAWWALLPPTIGLGLVLFQLGNLLGLSYWAAWALTVLGSWLATLVQFGLMIEGAPWVRLTARDKPWNVRGSMSALWRR
jgi:hypothetical protein